MTVADEVEPLLTPLFADGALTPLALTKMAERTLADRREAARAECARRITARASLATQSNMNAYAAVLSAKATKTAADLADLAAFAEAVTWVAAMRSRWPEIASQGLDPADDAHWPEASEAAIALASRF